MKFLAAVCPHCGGNLQLPDDRDVVKCMYCGVNVVVQKATQLAPGNKQNFLELAEHAYSAGNYNESYEYYTKVLEIEPNNSKAWFGKGNSAGWLSKLSEFRFNEMLVAYENAIKFAPDDSKEALRISCAVELNAVAIACHAISRKHMLEFIALADTWGEYLDRCGTIMSLLEVAHSFDPNNIEVMNNIVYLCKDNIEGAIFNDPYNSNMTKTVGVSDEYESGLRSTILEYSDKIKNLNPNYVVPEVKKASACFVVTATMGNEEHSSVQILRTFRDNTLSEFKAGRMFIDWYYTHGPSIAKYIEQSTTARILAYILIVTPSVSTVKFLRLLKLIR